MTQQTLRKKWIKFNQDMLFTSFEESQTIADFFLARFKEFAEKELIEISDENFFCDNHEMCEGCCGEHCCSSARNALRNEQRAALSEKLK